MATCFEAIGLVLRAQAWRTGMNVDSEGAVSSPRVEVEILARDKASLDIVWLRDESLEDSANLPDPHILAAEIADDLRASLEQMEDVLSDLQARANRQG
jgi:type I restriction enzyme M protein